MKDTGSQAALRASLVLLGAATLRLALAPPPVEGPLPLTGRPAVGDSLSAAADSLAEEEERRSRPLEQGETIDVNLASEADLDRLPGVGPARAQRIVADRAANGPYGSLAELGRVPGLGSRSLERIQPFLEFPAGGGARTAERAKERLPGRRSLGGVDMPIAPAGQPAVHLNTATREELETLPGIGPVLARRILEHRDRRGGFSSTMDLMDVPGVGPATFARLRALVVVP